MSRYIFQFSCVVILITGLLLGGGCSGEEEKPAPQVQQAPAVKQNPAPAPDAAQPSEAVAPKSTLWTQPFAADVLKYTPARAQIAVGIPPMSEWIERGKKFQNIREEMKELLDFNYPEDDPYMTFFMEMFDENGELNYEKYPQLEMLDIEESVGFFADFSSLLTSPEELKVLSDQFEADMEKMEAGDFAAGSSFMKMDFFDYSVLSSIGNAALVEDYISLINNLYGVAGDAVIEPFADVEIRVYPGDGPVYAQKNGYFLMASNPGMMKATLVQLDNPVELSYGAEGYHTDDLYEMAMLLFPDSILQTIKDAEDAFVEYQKEHPESGMFGSVSEDLVPIEEFFAGRNHPVVMTTSYKNDSFYARFGVNMREYPEVAAYMGTPPDLTLMNYIPADAVMLLTMGISAEMKEAINKELMPMLAEAQPGNPATGMGGQAMEMIGNEIAIGILPGGSGLIPRGIALVHLSQPEQVQTMSGMFLGTAVKEEYKGTEIAMVDAGGMATVSVAFYEDKLVLATDMDAIKTALDSVSSGEAESFLEGLDLPLNSKTEYQMFSLMRIGELLKNFQAAATMMGGMPPEQAEMMEGMADFIPEIIINTGKTGDWFSFEYAGTYKLDGYIEYMKKLQEMGLMDFDASAAGAAGAAEVMEAGAAAEELSQIDTVYKQVVDTLRAINQAQAAYYSLNGRYANKYSQLTEADLPFLTDEPVVAGYNISLVETPKGNDCTSGTCDLFEVYAVPNGSNAELVLTFYTDNVGVVTYESEGFANGFSTPVKRLGL